MSFSSESIRRWLRHRLPIPKGRQDWQQLLGVPTLLVLLAVWAGLLWLWLNLGGAILVAVASGSVKLFFIRSIQWLAVGAVTAPLSWFLLKKLCGPVLFYDLLRTGRRSRYILFRVLYVTFLLLVLCYVYAMWQESLYFDRRNSLSQAAEFAQWFFYTLMAVQLLVVLIMTPAYLAGAIAEEKDRKTLEFLLATDLRSREIVLSKLLARLANMTLIVLAALPILSAMQFFGGVDPDLLLASFAALGLTMMSLAAVSILMSVHSRRPRDAIVLTYLLVVMYPVLGFLALGLLAGYPTIGTLGIPLPGADGTWWLDINDLVGAFNAGNIIWVLIELGTTLGGGGSLSGVLPSLLGNYAIFHGSLTLLFTVWAVLRLRPVALKEAFGKPKKVNLGVRLFGRPAIGTQPMLWKEIFAESGLNFHWLGRALVCILVAISFLPVVFILYEYLEYQSNSMRGWISRPNYLAEMMNVWVRIAGTIAAVLLLLTVAVRASSAISGERDKQTLDGLLTTPLDSQNILFAKWVGAILSVRWGWVWLATIWTLGVVTGGVQLFALPVLVAAWAIYAGVFACVGLWYSTVSRTTLRSTLWTLLTTLFIGGGHWIVMGMCCFLPLGLAGVRERDFEYLMKFEVGQTPPAVLGILAFNGEEFERGRSTDFLELIGFSLFGLGCWAVAGLVLANFLMERFRRVTNRLPVQRPERSEPRPGWNEDKTLAIEPQECLMPNDECLKNEQ